MASRHPGARKGATVKLREVFGALYETGCIAMRGPNQNSLRPSVFDGMDLSRFKKVGMKLQ